MFLANHNVFNKVLFLLSIFSYSRFVHGKNLANKSQKDLDCILGRNRKKEEPEEEEPIKEEVSSLN